LWQIGTSGLQQALATHPLLLSAHELIKSPEILCPYSFGFEWLQSGTACKTMSRCLCSSNCTTQAQGQLCPPLACSCTLLNLSILGHNANVTEDAWCRRLTYALISKQSLQAIN